MITEDYFTMVYNSYSAKVYRLCLGYASGDKELAKEWLQETFLKVWKHKSSFEGKSTIETWIYRIAVNVCLTDIRKNKKNRIKDKELLVYNENDGDLNVDNDLTKMYACINKLTEQNKVLILLELENIPQATIADTVGLAHGTLRTRLNRIRQSLKNCITNGKK